MSDIVDRLRSDGDSERQLFREARATLSPVLQDAADEIERLRSLLELYRDAVRIDAKMEGPVFAGMNRSALKRAWDADLAALEGK